MGREDRRIDISRGWKRGHLEGLNRKANVEFNGKVRIARAKCDVPILCVAYRQRAHSARYSSWTGTAHDYVRCSN